jgi:hypothetical protein
VNYLAASTKAVLMTFTGSIIPDSIIFTYSPDTSKEGRNAQANYCITGVMNQTTLIAFGYLWEKEDKPVAASYPSSGSFCSNSLPTTTAPSTPALEAIVYTGIYSQM